MFFVKRIIKSKTNFFFDHQKTKSKSSAIINANNANASTNAKPNIVIVNTCSLASGFLPTAEINAAKIEPIPIPEPMTPKTAIPAPNSFADSISMKLLLSILKVNVNVLHHLYINKLILQIHMPEEKL